MSYAESSERSAAGRPMMCRECGAIVAAGETRCGQCGAPLAGTMRSGEAAINAASGGRAAPDNATIRFAQALFSRPATFTLLFLVANILLYIMTELAGGTRDPVTLINFGAKVNSLIDAGEWWRFVAPVFLHGGIFHLLMNMYGLWTIGPYVERLYGSARFVVIWVLTGVAGVVASYYSVQPELAQTGGTLGRFLFKGGDAVSVGASGALFGLIGVLFVFGIKFRRELPEGFKRAFGTGMLPTILINIFIGYAIPVIDNAAHLGGLVAGALLALVIGYKRIGPRQPAAYLWHLLQAAALLLVAASFAFVAHNYTGAPPSLANLKNFTDNIAPTNPFKARGYLEATNEGQQAFLRSLTADDPAPAAQALDKLRDAPTLDSSSEQLKEELRSLLERARDIAAQKPTGAGSRSEQTRLLRERVVATNKLIEDFNLWQARHREWVTTEGKRYGIELRERPAGEASTGEASGEGARPAEPASER